MIVIPASERLNYSELNMAHAAAWAAFCSDAEALKFLQLEPTGLPLAIEWINRQQKRYADTGLGLWALTKKEDNALVGICGLLWQEVDGEKELEIGYHLIPAYWHTGYATEAAIAWRDLAFNQQLADSVISVIDIGNINSQKVALRNGMLPEKETEFRGHSVIIFRISREKWLSLK